MMCMKLADLKDVLIREREKALKDVSKFIVPVRVLDFHQEIATLESRFAHLFESGDVLGIILSHGGKTSIRQLGTVIDSSRDILTVFAGLNLKEGWNLEIVNYEPLIAFDLQIELISRIEEGKLQDFEKKAVDLFFEDVKVGETKRVELKNKRNVKDEYLLDEYQTEAVEAALALEDGEFLLIRGLHAPPPLSVK